MPFGAFWNTFREELQFWFNVKIRPILCMIFFSLGFSLHEFFFSDILPCMNFFLVFSPPPPPITFLMVRPYYKLWAGRGVILKFKVTGVRGVMRKLFEVSSRFGDFLQGIVLGREIITVTLCKMILSITFISKLRYKTTINTDKKTWDFSRYCGFQKHANSEIQNTIKGLRFSLPSII